MSKRNAIAMQKQKPKINNPQKEVEKTPSLCRNSNPTNPKSPWTSLQLDSPAQHLHNRDLGNAASLETLLNTLGQRERDGSADFLDICTGDW